MFEEGETFFFLANVEHVCQSQGEVTPSSQLLSTPQPHPPIA